MSEAPTEFSWWRAAIVLSLMSISFTGGSLLSNHEARLDSIEVRELSISAVSDAKEIRLRALEIQQASVQTDISAIRAILTRMERGLEGDRRETSSDN